MKKRNYFLSLIADNKIRAFILQAFFVLLVIFLFYNAVDNLTNNIEERNITTGFSFLFNKAGFDINESIIAYSSEDSNLRAFYVGIINTLFVAAAGIFLSTIIGFIIGIARLSNNWLVSKMANAYIECFRNIPILLQILFWYNISLISLPLPNNSFNIFNSFFINKRGIYSPEPHFESGFIWVFIVFILGIIASFIIKKYFKRKQEKTGIYTSTIAYSLAIIFIPTIITFFLLNTPLSFTYPELKGFNFVGGMTLSPEFLALTTALSIYTATYIAEAIRSGIESVNKGQKEAASALGLNKLQSLKLVILPQALRVAIPPTINQYLNLTKNSSLAAAIGYPELMSVFGGTVLNQVGQAVEILGITMAVYLVISLFISFVLNIFNKKLSLKER